MDTRSRAELSVGMARLAAGDRSAQKPVFEAVWPAVRAFCRRVLKDESAAEDAAQQAVIRLFEQASDFQRDADALSWALEIASWECRTQLRRRGRSREGALNAASLGVPSAEPTPEQSLEELELQAAVREVVGELAPAQRAALGEKNEPRISDATWRKRRERALTRLKTLWRSRHDG
jgi:RNA polymerase sigma factor (sigma-70 family)